MPVWWLFLFRWVQLLMLSFFSQSTSLTVGSLLSAFPKTVCEDLNSNFYRKSNIGENLRLNVIQSTSQ